MGWLDTIKSGVSSILSTAKSKADEVARAVEKKTGVDIPFLGDTYVKLPKDATDDDLPTPKVSKNATPEEVIKAAEVAAGLGAMARPDYGKTTKTGDTVVRVKPVPKPVQEYYKRTEGGITYRPVQVVEEEKTTPSGASIHVATSTVYAPETPAKATPVNIPAYVDPNRKTVYIPKDANIPNVPNEIPVTITNPEGKPVRTERYKVQYTGNKNIPNATPTTITGQAVTKYSPIVSTTTNPENIEYWAFRKTVERKMNKGDIYTGVSMTLAGLVSWDDFLNLKSTYYAVTGQRKKYIDTQVNKMWKLYKSAPRDEKGNIKPLGTPEAIIWTAKTGVTSPTSLLAAVGSGIGYAGTKGVAFIGSRFGPSAGAWASRALATAGIVATGSTVAEPLAKGDVGEAINRAGMAAYTWGFATMGSRAAAESVLKSPDIASVSKQTVENLGEKSIVKGNSIAVTKNTKAAVEYVGDLDTYRVPTGQVHGKVPYGGGKVEYSIHGRPVDVAVGDVAYSGKIATPFGTKAISGTTPYASQSYTVAGGGKASVGISRTVTKGYTGSDFWTSFKNGSKSIQFSAGGSEEGTPRLFNITLSELLGGGEASSVKGFKVFTPNKAGGFGIDTGTPPTGSVMEWTPKAFKPSPTKPGKITFTAGGGEPVTGGGSMLMTRTATATLSTTSTRTVDMTTTLHNILTKGIDDVAASISRVIGLGGTVAITTTRPRSVTKTKTTPGEATKTKPKIFTELRNIAATITQVIEKPPIPGEKPATIPKPAPPVEVTKTRTRHRHGTTTVTIPKHITSVTEKEAQEEIQTPLVKLIQDLFTRTDTTTVTTPIVTTKTTPIVTTNVGTRLKAETYAPTRTLRLGLTGLLLRKHGLNLDLSSGSNARKWPLWGFGSRGEKAKIGLLADWISVNVSAARYGKATHPAPTPKILHIARSRLFQFLPTVELMRMRKPKKKANKKKRRR